ncbi:MAG: hypothetical protein V1743_05495 [Nanoarchaeota archaeon]
MDEHLEQSSEDLLKRLEKIWKFQSKYDIFNYGEAGRLAAEMSALSDTIPDITEPQNHNDLLAAELKRRLRGEASILNQRLSGNYYDFEAIISMYAIPLSDIHGLSAWLHANKERTVSALDRLFTTRDLKSYELDLPTDIPAMKRQAEEFSAVHIQRYHKQLGQLLQELTKVGEYLRDMNAVPTTLERSYFNHLTNTLAIAITAICYGQEDFTLQIREQELIRIYGHEGMGHALHKAVTHVNSLPYFLTTRSFLTESTGESIAQYYQRVLFEDLKNSPEVQKNLGIEHKFDVLYQEEEDTRLLEDYRLKLNQFMIYVLADKNFGDPRSTETIWKKFEILQDVALDPTHTLHALENLSKDKFDSQGNLDFNLVSELRYCAQPVHRALDEFAKQGVTYDKTGRDKIDATLLKGFWTPTGFVDHARIAATSTT